MERVTKSTVTGSESELTAWKRQTLDITEPGRGRDFQSKLLKTG